MATIDRLALAVPPIRPLVGGDVRFEGIDAEGGDILRERGRRGAAELAVRRRRKGGAMSSLDRIDSRRHRGDLAAGGGAARSATIEQG